MKAPRLTALLALLAGLAVLAFVLAGVPPAGTGLPDAGPASVAPRATPAAPAAPAAPRPAANPSGLPEVRASELPAEARQTLALIARGGPYPYPRDGVTFGNFERILPRQSSGYYKEYTVSTPGEADRGARRIVAGQAGEKYYTPDHYSSFKFIAEGK
ncbi:ribonuclease domain-containing protein [Arthrobacter sp. PsM3]|uniref:ribonuclease domain-containing protein n=1 Tax=Arthrobacter sp. PsM3 TaxID=3030531 RepID=UPI00263AFC20|nr:ribonuclease domain-containing protein [Arthrobacter sp. PsM3]MDN4642881.1 ribonuclease domain-containing protein [Arthrobacter sp. PsM3]